MGLQDPTRHGNLNQVVLFVVLLSIDLLARQHVNELVPNR